MGEKIIQPPFYNSGVYNSGVYNSGVYNSGVYNGGGGGGNKIIIDGYEYEFVQIGSLYWITENLRVNAPNAVTYLQQQDLNEYGLYYQPTGDFPVIESLLPDGWRIATRNDFLNLYAFYGNSDSEFIRNCFSDRYDNAENLSGLNFLSCGYRGSGNTWYYDYQRSIIWTNTKANTTEYYDLWTNRSGNSIFLASAFMADSTNGGTQYRSVVRICKDS